MIVLCFESLCLSVCDEPKMSIYPRRGHLYYDSPQWQNKGILKKTLLFCLQLIFVIITSIGYIFILLCPKCTTCVENPRLWKFKKQFEHPYSKFINHVMSYVAFLCLIYASSFEYEIRAGWGALTWIGK